MPFKKGKSGNPNGRPQGAIGTKTKEWQELGDAIMGRHMKRFNKILDSMEDEKFKDTIIDLLEYFQPKLSRTEMQHEGSLTITQITGMKIT